MDPNKALRERSGPPTQALKCGSQSSRPKPTPGHYARRLVWLMLALVTVLCLRSGKLLPTRSPTISTVPDTWPWVEIKPSRTLEWHRCYSDEYDCARLDVPLDWLDPSDEDNNADRVVLAVIRLRATEEKDYRGPVFFNPGGPGGSGIWSMLDHGKLLQEVIGTNHDIVTFDPRGIGASVPRIECWRSDLERTFWKLADTGVADAHPAVVYDEYARATAVSQKCELAMGGSGILRHIGTASHARDMLEILDRMGHGRLKYWGFSYGTVLGGTFAAMYPDRVERLVSDGNVDYNEWYRGAHVNFLRDADKILDAFYELCASVGPLRCAFHAPSAEAVEARFKLLLENLRVSPVVIPAGGGGEGKGPEMPEVVTYSKVRKLLSSVLYQPLYKFPQFAEALAGLERGDGLPYFGMVQAGRPPLSSFCSALPVEPSVPLSALVEGTADAYPAVMCADHEAWNGTVGDYAKLAEELLRMSFSVGGIDSLVRVGCVGRTVRPRWRFAGPFEARTAFPILFVANMADNVTPLVSARNNSQGFEGSVVLVQNSYGHTSLSTPSTCTAGHIRAYFQEGRLPAPDTKCEPDYVPFDLFPGHEAEAHGGSRDKADLARAVRELSEKASASLGRRPL